LNPVHYIQDEGKGLITNKIKIMYRMAYKSKTITNNR